MWTTRLSMQKLHSCSCLHDTSHITLARVLQQVLHYSQLFIVGIMWIISQDVQRDRSKYVGMHIPKDLNWSAITSSPLKTIQCLHFLRRLRATNPYHCSFTRSLQGQQKRKPYMWFYKCPQTPSTPNTGCWPQLLQMEASAAHLNPWTRFFTSQRSSRRSWGNVETWHTGMDQDKSSSVSFWDVNLI